MEQPTGLNPDALILGLPWLVWVLVLAAVATVVGEWYFVRRQSSREPPKRSFREQKETVSKETADQES